VDLLKVIELQLGIATSTALFTIRIYVYDRATRRDLRGWVTSRLNFRLKGYVWHQYLWTARWGNGYTTTLPLEIFTQRNFVADFIRLKLNFINNT